jgi:hypothetical protein
VSLQKASNERASNIYLESERALIAKWEKIKGFLMFLFWRFRF